MNGSFGTRRPRLWVALPTLILVLSSLGFASRSPVAAATPLTNLAHLDSLGASITPPVQAGHTTYGMVRIRASRCSGSTRNQTGAGAFGTLVAGRTTRTNSWGQGSYDTDDLARAAVVYIRHWQQFGDAHSRDLAYELLRTVTYMQTVSNDARNGNFVLWMQPDGTLHASVPGDLPDPSDSGSSYWLARSLWALGEGYAAFRDADPAFAEFLQERFTLARQAVERENLVHFGSYTLFDGAQMPAWLINDGADASSEAMYGFSAYVAAAPTDGAARQDLERLAEGVADMALSNNPDAWPFGAVLPFTGSRSLWHSWGDQMSGSLATAGAALHEQRFIDAAISEEAGFVPHLLVQGGPDQEWRPARPPGADRLRPRRDTAEPAPDLRCERPDQFPQPRRNRGSVVFRQQPRRRADVFPRHRRHVRRPGG